MDRRDYVGGLGEAMGMSLPHTVGNRPPRSHSANAIRGERPHSVLFAPRGLAEGHGPTGYAKVDQERRRQPEMVTDAR